MRFVTIATLAALVLPAAGARGEDGRIAALGRLEPEGGVLRLSGPSVPAAVVRELAVEGGDWVEAGQVIAVLDSAALHQASAERLRAERDRAERELARVEKLFAQGATSDSARDEALVAARIARANLAGAEAELERSRVRSPVAGRVLEVHARPGEKLGPEGVVEIGRTDRMFAVAEVYETDIARVREGQRAIVTSPALPGPLEGSFARIGLKIGKLDLIDADPVAKADARVVEVQIRLAGGPDVSGLTNLQVYVEILP